MPIGVDELMAGFCQACDRSDQMNDGNLSAAVAFDLVLVQSVEHRRARREVERDIVVQHAARPDGNARSRPAILNARVGDVDRMQPAIAHLPIAVQTTSAQNARQIVQMRDVVEQDRIRRHSISSQLFSAVALQPTLAGARQYRHLRRQTADIGHIALELAAAVLAEDYLGLQIVQIDGSGSLTCTIRS